MKKIFFIISLLLICCSCGNYPKNSYSRSGKNVNYETALGEYVKYFKIPDEYEPSCTIVKNHGKEVGYYLQTGYYITDEPVDFLIPRPPHIYSRQVDLYQEIFQYHSYQIHVYYYLLDYETLDDDGNNQLESVMTTMYTFYLGDKIITNGSYPAPVKKFGKQYTSFDEVDKSILEDIKKDISQELDELMNLE